ncbi:GSCOCG00009242001-RA-CDS, partial [Cotesia congregata]
EDPDVKLDNSVELHTEIKNRWKTWIKEGLSDEVKNNLLKKYVRKRELYTEPPKINLEIVGALAEVTKKRDQHFVQI